MPLEMEGLFIGNTGGTGSTGAVCAAPAGSGFVDLGEQIRGQALGKAVKDVDTLARVIPRYYILSGNLRGISVISAFLVFNGKSTRKPQVLPKLNLVMV